MLKDAKNLVQAFLYSLAFGLFFSLISSVFIVLGINPETRWSSDFLSPLLGLFWGTGLCLSKSPHNPFYFLKIGAGAGLSFILIWFCFWLYLGGRLSPSLWWNQALPRLTTAHLMWWSLALITSISGGYLGSKLQKNSFLILAVVLSIIFALITLYDFQITSKISTTTTEITGYNFTKWPPEKDGTIIRLLSSILPNNSTLILASMTVAKIPRSLVIAMPLTSDKV